MAAKVVEVVKVKGPQSCPAIAVTQDVVGLGVDRVDVLISDPLFGEDIRSIWTVVRSASCFCPTTVANCNY